MDESSGKDGKSLQSRINEEYPPTMTFNLSTLEPTRELAERWKSLRCYGEFWNRGKKFLDIGANKGWFSIKASEKGMDVVSIEPYSYDTFVNVLIEHDWTIEAIDSGFRDFTYHEQFDRIFIGNAHHHVHKECGGWEWIDKLAALSSDLVLIEGPRDGSCRDLDTVLSREQVNDFDNFISKMERHFTLISCQPTIRYTPDRYIMLFERKPLCPIPEGIEVINKPFKDDNYVYNNKVQTLVASYAPRTTSVIGITDVGWVELRLDSEIYVTYENQLEILKAHCRNNIYLSKIGYIDFDLATINHFKPSMLYFDKSAVIPIQHMNERHSYAIQKLFDMSFNFTSVPQDLLDAMDEKDAVKIQEAWKGWLQRLEA